MATTDIDDSALVIPLKGIPFWGTKNKALTKTDIAKFKFDGSAPDSTWLSSGHTHEDEPIAYSKEGGDKTVKNSWLKKGLKILYAPEDISGVAKIVQNDTTAKDLAYNGWIDPTTGGYVWPSDTKPLERSLFILYGDYDDQAAIYFPNVLVKQGDIAPYAVDDFEYLNTSFDIREASSIAIPLGTGEHAGRAGRAIIFDPEYWRVLNTPPAEG